MTKKTKEFRPMLADPIEPEKYPLRFPLMVSPKLDGIRCVVRDGVALSRSLKPIPNKFVQFVLGRDEFNGLDGELIVGSPCAQDAMQATTKGVMREDGEPSFTWFVFDDFSMVTSALPFAARFEIAGKRLAMTAPLIPCVKMLGHGVAHDQAQLDAMEASALAAGFEGLMVRDPNGRYKYGRSTAKEGILNKVKRFSDAEADVIGFEERMHNDNEATVDNLGRTERSTNKAGMRPAGDLGALVCQLLDQDGGRVFVLDEEGLYRAVTFNIGTGFTQAQREELWAERDSLAGRMVKFRHFAASGVKTAPRFPVFVGFRSPLDL